MKVLVATDGHLQPSDVTTFVKALAGDDGTVVVLTVVEIPRTLLSDLRSVYGEQPPVRVDSDAEYVKVGGGGSGPVGWPGDDAVIERYLSDQGERRTGPMVDALRQAGVDATPLVKEHESTASAIVAAADEAGADVIVVGSHGRGRFEGLLGSTGAKVTRMSRLPVLLIRKRGGAG